MTQSPSQARALGIGALLALSLLAQSQAQKTPVQYVFAHGISNNCDTFFSPFTPSTGADCRVPVLGKPNVDPFYKPLAAKIQTPSSGDSVPPLFGKTVETKNTSIFDQARIFRGNASDTGIFNTSSNLPIVIVAHSQGVLRSREVIQRWSTSSEQARVKGLISISGPNAGAPITVNAPAYARSVLADASTAGLLVVAGSAQSAWNLLVGLFTVSTFNVLGTAGASVNLNFSSPQAAYNEIERVAAVSTTAPGLVDMNPGSAFLNTINNLSNCYLSFSSSYPFFQYICQSTPVFSLPSSVNVGTIRGRNNQFWNGLVNGAYGTTIRIGWNNYVLPTTRDYVNAGFGAVRAYAYTQQAGCNVSLQLWQAACDSWNATLRFLDKTEDQDRALKTLVGDVEGDGTVALSSQSVYAASPSLGGYNMGTLNVDDGSHGGENAILEKPTTMENIRYFQRVMSVPESGR